MTTITRPFGKLRSDEAGATALEFGLVAPIFIMMLMALFDFGFQIYAQSVLQGGVQAAARSATLETGGTNSAAIDKEVEDIVRTVVPGAAVTFSRRNYANFEDVGKAEDFDDTDGDGICNNGEPFEDVNGNGAWDTDRGADGLGGARDAVLYGASVEYQRVFPFHKFIGVPGTIKIEGSTVLRNQPFNEQGERTPVVGACT